MFSISSCREYIKQHYILPIAMAGFVVGTPNDDVLSDAGKLRDFVYAESGNDVLVYTPSINLGKQDSYDGGIGVDTLWLRMSAREFDRAEVRADLVRFYYHILNNADVASPSKSGLEFKFDSFGLTVSNIENVILEPINTSDVTARADIPKNYKRLKNSSQDSLT